MKKILFLAQFAPVDGKYPVLTNPEEKFYAETYHFKIYDVLKNNNYNFYSTNDINHLMTHYDEYNLVWSVYNRLPLRNSEIFIQSLCEYYKIPYIGATPNIRALIEDKAMSKQLAYHLGITTADWVTASKEFPLSSIPPFNGPYFVKPRFGSASIGIDESCLCSTWDTAIKKSNEFFKVGVDVIIEKFIDGTYYGVPILQTINHEPMIATPHYQLSDKIGNIITNKQKRFTESGMSRFMSKEENLNKTLKYMSYKYFMDMQPCDYARIDYIVENSTGIPYFLEVNALMNLGIYSGFVTSFLNDKLFDTYESLIKHIISLGLNKIN